MFRSTSQVMFKIVQQIRKQIKMKVAVNFTAAHSSAGCKPLMGFTPDPQGIYTPSVQLSKRQIRQGIWLSKTHRLSCALGHRWWLHLFGNEGGRRCSQLCKATRKSRCSLGAFLCGRSYKFVVANLLGPTFCPLSGGAWGTLLLSRLSYPRPMGSRCSSSIRIFRDTGGIIKYLASHGNRKTLILSHTRAVAPKSRRAAPTSRGSREARAGKCAHLEGEKSKRRWKTKPDKSARLR